MSQIYVALTKIKDFSIKIAKIPSYIKNAFIYKKKKIKMNKITLKHARNVHVINFQALRKKGFITDDIRYKILKFNKVIKRKTV